MWISLFTCRYKHLSSSFSPDFSSLKANLQSQQQSLSTAQVEAISHSLTRPSLAALTAQLISNPDPYSDTYGAQPTYPRPAQACNELLMYSNPDTIAAYTNTAQQGVTMTPPCSGTVVRSTDSPLSDVFPTESLCSFSGSSDDSLSSEPSPSNCWGLEGSLIDQLGMCGQIMS